ncbi:MAG: archease [Aquificaceae bacterium]
MSFYETIDRITADAGIRVRARSLQELICKSILATFNEITPIQNVPQEEAQFIEATSEMPFLLADLINMALVLHDSQLFIASSCEVVELTPNYAKVKLVGSKYNPQEHEPKLVIKAATYHDLRVEKEGDTWVAEVIFDI